MTHLCLASRAGLIWSLLVALPPASGQAGQPKDAAPQTPGPPPAGFEQKILPAFDVQTDVSKAYLDKLARQVYGFEQRMYALFNFSAGFLKGNDRAAKLGSTNIPGDTLSKMGFTPWIELRVYKKYENYADDYFEASDRMVSLINKTPLKKETPEQRAVRRLTEGVPGAYYMRTSDYDEKHMLRLIRAYLGPKSPEELESEILHEMGHLFLETYLFEFAGAPKAGHEAEKRGTPAWIGEGIAQLFEINWSSSKQSQKLKLRNAGLVYEAVKAGDAYPFDKFITVTNAHNLMAVAGDPLKATLNYVQSYSVMMYMVEKDWPRFLIFLAKLRQYNLEALRSGSGRVSELYSIQDRAFNDAFGIPLLGLEKYWTKHVLEDMEKELKAKPAGYYWCGEYYLLRKEPDKAEERFKLAVAGAPRSGEGYLGLGRVALLKGDTAAALASLAKATELSPTEEDGFYYLAQAQLAAGRGKEAIASLEQALKLYPLFHQAYALLGQACFQARDYQRAMTAYEQAFQIQRNNPYYLLAKGRAAFYAHEYTEAQRNFAIYSEVFTKDAQGLLWYGLAAWRLGQKEFALQKIEAAAKLEPKDATIQQTVKMARQGEVPTFAGEVKDAAPEEKAGEDGKGTAANPFVAPAKTGTKDEE